MGGGGANSLDSPKIGESSDFEDADLSDNDNKEETTWDIPTYKTYEDYFTDYNITAETITDQDLTGAGSVSDPYVVHSTRGFLWLAFDEISGINLSSKYLELACDVVLNDEVFDENGNPSGGDGVVYSWQNIDSWRLLELEGNDFCISGVYLNKESEEIVCFCESTLKKLSNLNMKNIFIKGQTYVSCFGSVYNARNCNMLSGNVVITADNGYGSAFFDTIITNANKCNNYANVGSRIASIVGGIARRTSTYALIEDCCNYGTVTANTVSGGIIGNLSYGTLDGCKNYGKVIAYNYHAGGFVGQVSSGKIINCINYGEVSSGYTNSTGITGAFVGVSANEELTISSCKNYGRLNFGEKSYMKQPGLIGYILGSVKDYHKINITNCIADSGSGEQIFQSSHAREGSKTYLNVSNCKIVHNNVSFDKFYLISTNIVVDLVLNIENVDIEFVNEPSMNMFFFKELYSYGNLKLNIKNMLVKSQNTETSLSKIFYYYVAEEKADINLNDVVIIDCYYGTDFSGFYIDWKTGEVGLKAFSNKGLFQGVVNEEILTNKGFEKKTI